MDAFTVSAPASTANLGPAFDCLGLALDLWNEARFEIGGRGVDIKGEGADNLPRDSSNLILRAFHAAFEAAGQPAPEIGLRAYNRIPLASGLGSSAAATACGLLAARQLLGGKPGLDELLQTGSRLEGHADNLAAALYGGLVLVIEDEGRFRAQPLEAPQLSAVVLLPDVSYSTAEARAALPQQVELSDAVFNLGKALQLAEALRASDIAALAAAMQDRLHQPYRLELMPGAAEALRAAQAAGAAAAISGAGPGLIAFCPPGRQKAISEALRAPFGERGIGTKLLLLESTRKAARISDQALS